MTLNTVATFLVSIALQVFALSLLPASEGFTRFWPTAALIVTFVTGIGLTARLSASGLPVSILIPIATAIIPLALIAVGVTFLGEQASPLRIFLLIVACVLVGVASSVR